MHHRFVIFSICLFITQMVFSQKHFIPGYLIKNNNDTIHGLISDRDEVLNCKKCQFKVSGESAVEVYYPNQISEYRFVDGKYYVSTSLDTQDGVSDVFFEFIINGIVDVYSFKSNVDTRYFVQKEGCEISELKIIKKTIEKDGQSYEVKNKQYLGYLNMLFSDIDGFTDDVNKVSLNRKSLINISQKYHSEVCEGEQCIIYAKKKERINFKLTPIAGFEKLLFTDDDQPLEAVDFTDFKSNDPVLNYGLSFGIIPPYWNQHVEIGYQGLYSHRHLSGTYLSHTTLENDYSTTYHYKPFDVFSKDWQHLMYLKYNLKLDKLIVSGKFGAYFYQNIDSDVSDSYRFDDNVLVRPNQFGGLVGVEFLYSIHENFGITLGVDCNFGTLPLQYNKNSALLFSLGFPISFK